VDAGVEGEERTAVLLWLLLKIPGVTVFHGLRFPGSRNADVDHAVVHGNNVYLIDSKQYRWGTYEWRTDPKYGERITAANGFGRKNHMDAAADGYRRILGHHVNVIPIVVIHGKNVKIGEKKWSSNGVGLFTPDEAMRFMGETISYDMQAWRDNVSVRAGLLQNMKR
jgi:acetyltransferase-like isoleucine patch superfamily enzyme